MKRGFLCDFVIRIKTCYNISENGYKKNNCGGFHE